MKKNRAISNFTNEILWHEYCLQSVLYIVVAQEYYDTAIFSQGSIEIWKQDVGKVEFAKNVQSKSSLCQGATRQQVRTNKKLVTCLKNNGFEC